MRRRSFLSSIAALSSAASLPTLARTKVHRIGVLLATSRKVPATARATQPFIDGLRDLGYVEGRNLVLEWREAEGRIENMPALAAELVASNVDLIVAGADSPATAAMKATASIPIVFVAVSDPVGLGLVKSLARPGTNLTGLASFAEALTGKQLELLREVFPRASRVAVFNTPGDPINASQLAGVRAASAALKMQVRLHDVVSESHLDAVFREIVQDRPDALQVFVTAAIWFHQRRIVEFAAAQRLPAVYANTAYVESGGLMGYSFSYEDLYRRSVAYVDKILKGTSPGVLPVEQPTKLDLALNVKTARALGIAFSHSMLARADRVIE